MKTTTELKEFAQLAQAAYAELNLAAVYADSGDFRKTRDVLQAADANARLYGDTTKAFDYSDNWYADRTILLTKLTERNTKDAANSVLLDDKTYRSNRTYVDFATGQTLTTRGNAANANVVEAQQILFGNDMDNGLIGSDAPTQGEGDALYGGAGNDYMDGKAGDDYLEGGIGDDRLVGGEGNDQLLGGRSP